MSNHDDNRKRVSPETQKRIEGEIRTAMQHVHQAAKIIEAVGQELARAQREQQAARAAYMRAGAAFAEECGLEELQRVMTRFEGPTGGGN